ncbi:MAG: GDP-L-fucose synthase [Phyllobacteriaceae bacterium]|nr:GDP-L-fucose synthase [Phyllobacteriaceae bacterium]
MYALDGKRIWIAGDRGMVGSALMRRLASEQCELLTIDRDRLDLRRQDQVEAYLQAERPDAIILAAARVGGILANQQFPVDFLGDNLLIATNVIASAHATGVNRLLFLGSSCVYPRDTEQPIEEGALLSGALEPTNEFYALAKIAGIKLVEAYRRQYGRDYIAAMPANLYGPGDNFDPVSGHVLPALIQKAHDAKLRGEKTLTIWGSGTPRREFLHVDDCADALVLPPMPVACSAPSTMARAPPFVCQSPTPSEKSPLAISSVAFSARCGPISSSPPGALVPPIAVRNAANPGRLLPA